VIARALALSMRRYASAGEMRAALDQLWPRARWNRSTGVSDRPTFALPESTTAILGVPRERSGHASFL